MRWIGIIVLGVMIGAGGLFAGLQKVQESLRPDSALDLHITPHANTGSTGREWKLLVLGSDERLYGADAGGGSRADSDWLVRLDPDRGDARVWSLPRDWLVSWRGSEERLTNVYGLGGPKALLGVIKRETGVSVDGVIMLRFGGFEQLVNKLGCLYVDVDRRYFNENVGTIDTNYSSINLQPGYQRLCGQDALAFARHRHSDNDLVRSKRQLRVLQAAEADWGAKTLLSSPDALLSLLGYVSTSIKSKGDLLSLGETIIAMRQAHVTNIPWKGWIDGPAVRASAAQVKTMRKQWEASAPAGSSQQTAAIVPTKSKKTSKARGVSHWNQFPLGAGTVRLPNGITSVTTRSYHITTGKGKPSYRAWRAVLSGWEGQAAGIQWTDWQHPPILRSTQFIGEKGCGGWFWVSNSLTGDLTQRQMRKILQQASCRWIRK